MEFSMARGKNKKTAQAEKLLLVLLDGHEAPVSEIQTLLSSHIVMNRFSAYLWDLKQIGAQIKRNRVGRNIVSYQLVNHEAMTAYARERELIPPPAVVLTASDLMVAAG
jgi:hypothetical protein